MYKRQVLVSANLKQIHVERIEAHESRTMFNLELPDNPTEAAEKLAAFNVRDGDDVVISQIQPYNSQAVYLEGHVFHPGKYPYKEGMTIADLLRSYQDVLPEPAERGELVRLQPPDYRPETIPSVSYTHLEKPAGSGLQKQSSAGLRRAFCRRARS